MDPIRLIFSPPLPAALVAGLRERSHELSDHLRALLIAELDRELNTADSPEGGHALRRASAGHLRWRLEEVSESAVRISAVPEARLRAAFDHSAGLCGLWLAEAVENWCRDNMQAQIPRPEPESGTWPNPAGQAVVPAPKSAGKAGLLRGVATAAFIVLMAVLGFTLYKAYRLVDEVHDSYSRIEETVEVKTDEILDKIERGITTSDRVVNMMDKVKNLVVTPDSSGK